MSDEKHDLSGPTSESLRRLYDQLPSMKKGVMEGKIGGKGNKVPARRPTKVCKICCKAYDFKEGPAPDVETMEKALQVLDAGKEPCPECDVLLKDGYIAFTCGDKFAFGRSEKLKDLGGTIVPVGAVVMQQLEDVFGMEWKTNDPKQESAGEA